MASKLSVSVRSFRFNENVIPARNRRPKSADVWMLSTLLLLLPPLIPRLAAHRSVNVPTGAVTLEAQIPSAPRPPCTTEAYPAYPSLGLPPAVTVWSAEALGRDWVHPPAQNWRYSGLLHFGHDGRSVSLQFKCGWLTSTAWRDFSIERSALLVRDPQALANLGGRCPRRRPAG